MGYSALTINRKPGEQVEVDWAGDPAHITDPVTGEIIYLQIPQNLAITIIIHYIYLQVYICQKYCLLILDF